MYAVRMRAAGKTLTGQELFDEIEDAGPDVQLYVTVGNGVVLYPVHAAETIGTREVCLSIETDVWERLENLTKFAERVASGAMRKKDMVDWAIRLGR